MTRARSSACPSPGLFLVVAMLVSSWIDSNSTWIPFITLAENPSILTESSRKSLNIGILAGVFNLDPLKAQDVDSLFVLRQVVESPFGCRPGSTELEPLLFSSGLRAEGSSGTVYRARLLPGLKYSDGSVVSADDVARCLSQVAPVREQARVDARGDEVTFQLREPNPRFEVVLSHPQCSIHKWQGDRLLGTGAYVLATDNRSERVHLLRNAHFRGEAPIEEVVFHVHPLDEQGKPTALLQAIQDGAVDFANVLARDDINQLVGVRKSLLPGISTALLYLNGDRPKLKDRRVRRAIAKSIDRVEVARTCYTNALAFAAPSLLPRALAQAEDDLGYDPQGARELIAEIGVEMPRSLSMLTMWGPRPYLPDPQKFACAISEQLGKIGIEVTEAPTSSSLEHMEKTLAGGEDLSLSGWVADVMDPVDYLEANLASSRVPSPDNFSVSANCGHLRSEEMDRAINAYRSGREEEQLADILRIQSEEAPLVPLVYGPTIAVVSFRVQGFRPSPLSIFALSELDLEA